jgi:predicted GNAT family N-acyltransferase
MKYELSKICADGEKHVAYVRVADDAGNDLGEICVSYDGNEDTFQQELVRKAAKIVDKHSKKTTIQDSIQNVLNKM